MKIIKNSIDSEDLQDTISDADLETEMASCEMKSDVFNGHNSEGITILDKTKMEGVEVKKLTNGIHGNPVSPAKCNGKVNGFYEEEDFNLVLEDSSEGGDSPSKKIDDDISAPQIVQQIEDLLGITSSSVGIEEELNNLDGTESMEDNLDNIADIEDSQNTQEAFAEIEDKKIEECQENVSQNVEKTDEIKKQLSKNTDTSECDTSAHINLVVDEVEIGMENGDANTPNECILVTKPKETENKVDCTTEANPEEVKDLITCETKDNTSKKTDHLVKSNEIVGDLSDEIPLSQTSGVSFNSEEWAVIDTIESDEEKLSESPAAMGNLVDSLPLAESIGNVNGKECEADCSLPLQKDSVINANSHVTNASENKENNLQNDNVTNQILPLSESIETKTNADITPSAQDDSISNQKQLQASNTTEITQNTSLLASEGDGVRKRCASLDEEEIEIKKPKLEDQVSLQEVSSPVLKRPSSITTENESKRTKLNESVEEHETPDCNMSEITDSVNDRCENELMVTENESVKGDQTVDVPIKSIPKKVSLSQEEFGENEVIEEGIEISTLSSSSVKTTDVNDDVNLPAVTEQTEESLPPDTSAKSSKDHDDIESSNEQILSNKKISPEEDKQTLTTTQTKQCNESLVLKDSEKSDEPQHCVQKTDKSECKENLSTSSLNNKLKEETGFKLDDLSSVKIKVPLESEKPKKTSGFPSKSETKSIVSSKQVPGTISKELSTSIKELEESLINHTHEKIQDSKDSHQNSSGSKKMTNLDFAIERVVEKARVQTEKKIPILKKFHKDQLKKLNRTELEDIVVSKICEAVTYKSEIGQMRLRTQSLEETNEMWRKKVQQIEKQNRELEMVVKRFLGELSYIKRENQNKVPMPIKVTRSVGLQVVLASSMHGALVTSRNKANNEATLQQQNLAKARQSEREKEKEKVKESVKVSFVPPVQSTVRRGRPPKSIATQNSRPSTPQTLPAKVTPPTTPSKPVNTTPVTTPVKIIPPPSKDLEVIDLTDKEEKAKSTIQPPVGGSIRVAPSTQVCFVQQSAAPSPPQQPLYLVQKAGQRPQFLVATSTASPQLQQRPITNVARPPPALAIPAVFRSGGHLIPVQTTAPQVAVKTSTNTTQTAIARQVPTTLRIQQQPVVKHPAPLPSEPTTGSKPGMKAPPPKPQLKIAKTNNGIMLSWSMSLTKDMADMQSYQLYAYQEGNQPPSTGLWKKVGDVKALPLPMACTLTQFIEGHRYHFAVRARDVHGRIGPFSTPSSILLTK